MTADTAQTQASGLRFASPLMANYIAVPRVVMRDARLSHPARLLYVVLCDYAREGTRAYPGQETIGEHLGCHAKTVSRALRELCDVGLVVVRRPSRTAPNTYVIQADYATGKRPNTTTNTDTDEGTQESPRNADEGTQVSAATGHGCPPNEMQRTSGSASANSTPTATTTTDSLLAVLQPVIRAGRISDPRIDGSVIAIESALGGPKSHLVPDAIQQIAGWASDSTRKLRRPTVAGLLPSALEHVARRTRRDADNTTEDRPPFAIVLAAIDEQIRNHGRDRSEPAIATLAERMPAAAALAVHLTWHALVDRPIGYGATDWEREAIKTYRTLDLNPQPVSDYLQLLALNRARREALARGEDPYDPNHPLNQPVQLHRDRPAA
jgi:hypothetical protein